ncbi:MAG: T9SS type A sorting domain-containing protein [Bacteroidota bacterium]
MKLYYYLFLSLCIHIGFLSFSFAQNQIMTTGGTASGTGGSLSYSVGQLAYKNLSANTIRISEGVQQPREISTVVSIFIIAEEDIRVYPNPASEYLKLEYPLEDSKRKLVLFNITGKKILEKDIRDKENILEIAHLNPGQYSLIVQTGDSYIHAHKFLIK